MQKKLIKLSYTIFIDATSETWFEKNIFNLSYDEFVLKSQAYNQEKKFKTFTEMCANDGRANSMHYKCSFPILPFIDLLKNEIPGLKDNSGNKIKFIIPQFKLIESHVTDKSMHKFSITYITDVLSLHDNFGDVLLLSYGNNLEEKEGTPVENGFLLRIVENVSVVSYK
jgi:hypothetical protein